MTQALPFAPPLEQEIYAAFCERLVEIHVVSQISGIAGQAFDDLWAAYQATLADYPLVDPEDWTALGNELALSSPAFMPTIH